MKHSGDSQWEGLNFGELVSQLLTGAKTWVLTVSENEPLGLYKESFQIGTDSGYFPSTKYSETCHYVLDSNYQHYNQTVDHTHL